MKAHGFRQFAVVTASAVLALCLTAGRAGSAEDLTVLTRQTITVPGIPTALCNDGSPPVFYFRPGRAEDRDKWLIVFQDGGACASDAACATRGRGASRYYLSSTAPDVAPTFTADGILSMLPTVNPDFSGFNHVLLHYCSSDTFAGDTERMIDGNLWQFRGRRIVDALIEQLLTQPINGLSLKGATEVLVAGSSIGALGVHNNLDRIAARLPGVKVRGLLDSAWIPPGTIPLQLGTFATRPDQPAGMAYWNAHPDDSCVAASPQRPAACLLQSVATPYITTPVFVYMDQRDVNVLAQLGLARSPTSDDEGDYVLAFAAAVRDTLRASAPAYFAANVTIHNVLFWAPFYRITTDTETLGETLHRWYVGEPGNIKVAAPPPGSPPLSLTR